MIEACIRYSAKNRGLVLFLTLAACVGAWWAVRNIRIDAIPDLSDTQVIVYSRWDRSPNIIEDQVTYPIVTALLGAPKIKNIRGFSDFGFSYVYVIFEDGTDIYWARSRVLEYLSRIQANLPEGVKTELGPDATGVGWVYQYALVDKSGNIDISDLRSLQDFKLRFQLASVPGVAEVAALGGFKKQYQIIVDPGKLAVNRISMNTVIQKVKDSNRESGARLIEIAGAEYMIRGKGYVRKNSDLENIPITTDEKGAPLLLKHVARVDIGPDIRRGVGDLDGRGNTVSGIIVMRHGENAMNVIQGVKKRLEEVKPFLPAGVEIIPVYDRSELINHAIDNLKFKILEEIIIVSMVILIFLWHFPSAIIPILTIPISVLLAFIPMFLADINANLMSLAGIAISIGVLVDGAIVEVENAYKKLEHWQSSGHQGDLHQIRLEALLEVAPSVFYSLLVIGVAFMPVFTLTDQEGRLFKPLAYSKNLAMIIAAFLAITLDPAVRMMFTRMTPFEFKSPVLSKVVNMLAVGKYYPEEKHPVSKILFRYYGPVCDIALRHPRSVILGAFFLVLLAVPLYLKLGSEFMPPLYEESLLYMPNTMPGISVDQAGKLLTAMDKKLASIPEVVRVFGKSGRAETSTDSAPFSMAETVVLLKPQSEWRQKQVFYSSWPKIFQLPFRFFFSDKVTKDELIDILDREMQFPGVTNAWTMPIKNRIDMLSTGIRTPIGIKIQGEKPEIIEKTGVQIEQALRGMPGVRNAFAERSAGGYFLDVDLNREKLARFGISIKEAQEVLVSAIGGEGVSETIEGRQRYSINVRYPRDRRDSMESLRGVFLSSSEGTPIPLGEVADIRYETGPGMIRNENGFLTGYVYVDTGESDIGSFVEHAKKKVAENVKVPDGYSLAWSGQYENMIRVRERLTWVLPLTVLLIFLLIHANTKSYIKTFMVMCAVPFSVIGAIALLYILGYQVSIAVWVGMIALMGLDAETGVFMLMYLDLSYEHAKKEGRLRNLAELKDAIIHGAVGRVRPKMMTVMAAFLGLLPIMWATGAGSDMMKRIAAPMVGGLFTSFLLELLVYPSMYLLWKKRTLASVTAYAPMPVPANDVAESPVSIERKSTYSKKNKKTESKG